MAERACRNLVHRLQKMHSAHCRAREQGKCWACACSVITIIIISRPDSPCILGWHIHIFAMQKDTCIGARDDQALQVRSPFEVG